MNEASKLVADSILGRNFKTVILGGNAYTMGEPTIRTLCGVIRHWCRVDMKDELTKMDVCALMPECSPFIVKGLAVAIAGEGRWRRFREWRLRRELMGAKNSELRIAVSSFVELMNAEDFFVCATSAMGVAKLAAKPGLKGTTR